MTRTYVLDTNVLLHDPGAPRSFGEHDVAIPIWVIEEIDRFKRDLTEVGRNARQTSRWLDGLRTEGDLAAGVSLPGGGCLRVILHPRGVQAGPEDPGNGDDWIPSLKPAAADTRILLTALALRRAGEDAVLVTKDMNLRIRANALGLPAEDYTTDKVALRDLAKGWRRLEVPRDVVDALFAGEDGVDPPVEMHPNECALLVDQAQPDHTALARMRDGRLHPVRDQPAVWGIRPRNLEQRFALDLLLDPRIHMVTLMGRAGTGKTLLALAAGLHMAADEGLYRRVLVSRPVYPMGRDLGYLPGEMEEKLRPWMQPIHDNVELLLHLSYPDGKGNPLRELVEQDILQVEALTYIRGRSIPGQYMIIDEGQNLTPHEVKTIVTRAGEGTKVVLTGDPEQIDNPYVDAESNGLTYVAQRFRGREMAAHITLSRGERSPLAELAAELL